MGDKIGDEGEYVMRENGWCICKGIRDGGYKDEDDISDSVGMLVERV